MAGRIAGITIKIGADDSSLKKTIRGLDSQLSKTQSTLKDVNKLLKLDPKNTELLTQKQKTLKSAIDGSKKKIEELKNAQQGVAEGSEDWDTLQREIIATEQQLKSLEKEYKNFGSVGAQQAAAVGQKMQEVGGKIESAGKALQPLSTAATGVLAALAGLGYSAVTAADDLNTLAKQTGFSTEEIQKMQYASDLVDVSFESISGAVKKLKSKMDPANETLKALGVSVTDADGNLRDATEVFYDSLEALSQVENATERDQLAMDLFGKSADDLAGIIDDGGQALREYGQQAEDLGLILSQETLDDLNAINDTVDTLKANFKGAFAKLGATLAKTFAPALNKAAEVAQTLADKIANLSPQQAKLIAGIAGVVAALAPVITVVGGITRKIGDVLTKAPAIVSTISTVVSAIGWIPLAIAAAVAAGVWLYKHWDQVKEWAAGVKEAIVGAWNTAKEAVTSAVETIKSTAEEKWEALKTSVTKAATSLKTSVVGAWNSTKTIVTNVVSGIKTSVTDTWNSIKSTVSSTVSGIVQNITTRFNAAKATVTGIFTNIKNAITNKIQEAKTTVSNTIEAIKGFLSFEWSLPALKLPHIKLTKGEWPWGIMGAGVAPTVSIEWYKRAYQNPVMFTAPTVLATPNGYKGFGDGSGAEIVLGLEKLRQLVGTTGGVTVNVYPPAGANTEEIAAAVEQRLVAAQRRRMRAYA